MRKYSQDLKSAPHLEFVPFIVSSYGSLGSQARSFVERLADLLCKRWIWSQRDAENYVRKVVQASVFAFIGGQMLTTLTAASAS